MERGRERRTNMAPPIPQRKPGMLRRSRKRRVALIAPVALTRLKLLKHLADSVVPAIEHEVAAFAIHHGEDASRELAHAYIGDFEAVGAVGAALEHGQDLGMVMCGAGFALPRIYVVLTL